MTLNRRSVVAAIAGVWIVTVCLNVFLLPRKYALHEDVETVQLAPMPLIVWASGNLEAKLSLTVKAQFDGPILEKKFREGEKVKKGQLLVVMDRDRIRLDYQTKSDALKNAQADLAKSKKDLRLQKILYAKEAVAYSTVDDAKMDLVKKTQALAGAKETLRLEQQQWDSAKVYATFDGTIVRDSLADVKFVKTDTELFTIADVSEYTMNVQVDELDIKQVHEGQKAEVRLQIYKEVPLETLVREVGSQPEGTGLPQVPVILSLPDTKGLQLRPKLTGEARIFTGTTEPILSIPAEAVSNGDGEARVWVLGFLNKIHSVPVTLGRTNPDRVEIIDGLRPGERVCKSAEPEFAEGMRIVVGAPDKAVLSRTHILMKNLKRSSKSSDKDKTKSQGLFGLPSTKTRAPQNASR
jgi:RND family efflux transporter MFP subunit